MRPSPLANAQLSEEEIRARLLNHNLQSAVPPEDITSRRAAVLVPLIKLDGEWHLLLIRRTNLVAEHKGQVAFPGGAMDLEDADIEETALREAWEEVGLPAQRVKILGRLPDFYSVSNYLITPVVGVIDWPFDFRLSLDEVSRVFTIPLAWLSNPDNYEERPFIRSNGQHEQVIFFQEYDGELLWGVTARIMVIFLDILGLVEK